ncbi:unnamed protein product [Closterium sp. NIES-53]
MAPLTVLTFDHEGRPIQFDTWLNDLQLYLLSDSRDNVLLFDHTSGASFAPPATADSVTCSQWLTRDAAARLAVCTHLLLAERAHFGKHRTAKALYDAVVARYSSPAPAALGRLILPYLFPELSAFPTVEDLVTHLRTSDARYRATLPAEFLDRNPPSMDHFLALDPTYLTVDLLEKHLLAAETSVVAVGAARGTPRTPFFEGFSPSPLAPSYASAAAVDILGAEDVGASSAVSGKRRNSKGKGGKSGGGGSGGGGGGGSGCGGGGGGGGSGGSVGGSGGFAAVVAAVGVAVVAAVGVVAEAVVAVAVELFRGEHGAFGGNVRCRYVIRKGDRAGQTFGEFQSQHRYFSRLDNAWRAEFGDEAERPRWSWLLRSGVDIFALDYDAILAAMYALSVSAEGDCYLSVPPDLGIECAALGASESALPGTAPAEALHTFTLDSGASRCFFCDSTTLTPLAAPVPVRLADPSGDPVLARSSTVLLVSGGSVRLTLRSSPPLVLYKLGEYRYPPGCDGHYHHFWGLACVDLHVYTDGPSPGHVHSSASVESVHPYYRASSGSYVFPGVRVRSGSTPPCHAFVACTPASLSLVFPYLCLPSRPLLPRPAILASRGGSGRERYFLPAIDDYMRYTTIFPLRSKSQVPYVLIPWIRAVRLQLRERFRQDLPILRLHSDRGGEFSSDLLRDFCRGEGILQSFTLPDSPQQNGIAELRIGLVMEVARTSMIHAIAPHFLWPFAVRYAAHHLNLWPRVSLPKTLPTLHWTGKVGDASVFWFYHPTSRRVFPSQDVTFDKSVPFYRLFPYRSAPPQPPPLFLAPGSPPVDPLPPQGPAPLSVSQVDPLPGTMPVEVAVASGGARGVASRGAASGGAEPGGAESEGAGSKGAEPGGAEPGGAEPAGVLRGASPRLSPRPEPLSPHQLREWFAQRTRLRSGAAKAGDTGARGAAATGPGGARNKGTEAAGTSSVEVALVGGSGAGDPADSGGAGAGDIGAVSARAGGTSAGGAGAGGVGAVDPGVGGAGAGGTGAAGGVVSGGTGTGDTLRPRPYFVPLLQQPPLQPASPLPAPSPYTVHTGGLPKCREPESRPASLVRSVRTGRRVPRSRPPPVRGTHIMALRPSSVSLRVPLPSPPASSLADVLTLIITDPSFESAAASALVAELVDFAAAYRLDYSTSLVAESKSDCPPSVGGECALRTDVLEDRQEDFECLAAAVSHLVAMLLGHEGDPDAPDIPTLHSYAEAITGPYSSQWQTAMDAEMASWKSIGTYARYVARGFSQRQGVDFFHTFSPSPNRTTIWVLLHVAAQRDYELHSLDFSTAFLQGSLHEEIWLRRPPGFTGSFNAGTQWSLRRSVHGLRQAPREWHDTLTTTLAALGFAPLTADPSLFLRTDTLLPAFNVLVYVLQRFSFQYSSPQSTPLPTGHSLSAPPSDESVEQSGLYPELVSCLMYLMTCTRPDIAYPLNILACYVAPGRHRPKHWEAAKRVLRYFCSTSSMGLVLGGRGPVVLTGHGDGSWVDDLGLARTLLLLPLAIVRTSPLTGSTPTATTAAATTPTVATTAATTPTTTTTATTNAPTPTTTPTATAATSTTSTASTTASTAATPTILASLALAAAAPPTRSRCSPDFLNTKEVNSSSRSNRGEKGGGGTPLKEGSERSVTRSAYSEYAGLSCKEMLLEQVDSEVCRVKGEKEVHDYAKRVREAGDDEVESDVNGWGVLV